MPEDNFKARTPQDRLLLTYWKKVKGAVFSQVTVGTPSKEAHTRRIDGVRIPSLAPQLKKFAHHHGDFSASIKGRTIEAIEVTNDYLHRWVIGQAVVAKHLLEIEYHHASVVPVVVCKDGDKLMEQVCARLGVRVWTPRTGFLVK
jgi:hypothetical protein